MESKGIEPRAEHFNMLLTGLVRLGQHERAHAVLTTMLERGVRPTRYTYNGLLNATVRLGHRERAYQLLYAMEASAAHAPDGCTYNTVARLHLKGDEPGDAEALVQLLERARRRQVAPRELYHAVMSAHTREADGAAFQRVFEQMRRDGTGKEKNC